MPGPSLPSFIEPMALTPTRELPRGEEWMYEVKWDGYRCLALKHGNCVRLFSRRANDFTDKYPEVHDAVAGLRAHSAVLDGEIVALDADGRPCFQRLQNGTRTDCHLFYYAFDLLHLDGRDLLRVPLEERKMRLASLVQGSRVRYSAPLNGCPELLVAEITKMRLEALVAKRRLSVYKPGERTPAWQKFKVLKHGEFWVGG